MALPQRMSARPHFTTPLSLVPLAPPLLPFAPALRPTAHAPPPHLPFLPRSCPFPLPSRHCLSLRTPPRQSPHPLHPLLRLRAPAPLPLFASAAPTPASAPSPSPASALPDSTSLPNDRRAPPPPSPLPVLREREGGGGHRPLPVLDLLPLPDLPQLPRSGLTLAYLQHLLDDTLEHSPGGGVLVLIGVCAALVVLGGLVLHAFSAPGQDLAADILDAWSAFIVTGTHIAEPTLERWLVSFFLFAAGVVFFTSLTSTITTNFMTRMQRLKEGTFGQLLVEGHIVVAGSSILLPSLLRQLNKHQATAYALGTTRARRQSVVVISEQPVEETSRQIVDVIKECQNLKVYIRCGSIKSSSTLGRISLADAKSVILLAPKEDSLYSDASTVTSAATIASVCQGKATAIVVQVWNLKIANVLNEVNGNVDMNAMEDMSAKMFVQCTQQPGLVDVFYSLLDPTKDSLFLRSIPCLAGTPYGKVRQGLAEDLVVCGLVRDKGLLFHPPDTELLQETDEILLIGSARECFDPVSLPWSCPVSRSSNVTLPGERHKHAAVQGLAGHDGPETFLLMGWRPNIENIFQEFDNYVRPGSRMVMLTPSPVNEEGRPLLDNSNTLTNLHVSILEGNPLDYEDVERAVLSCAGTSRSSSTQSHQQQTGPGTGIPAPGHLPSKSRGLPFKICVVTSESKRAEGPGKPDELSLLMLFFAHSVCSKHGVQVESYDVEFQDTMLAKDVQSLYPGLMYIPTVDLMAQVLAQVALDSTLRIVWDDLLDAYGDEIYVKNVSLYKGPSETVLSFADIADRAAARKQVAIGYRHNNRNFLNPHPKTAPRTWEEGDKIIVIAEE